MSLLLRTFCLLGFHGSCRVTERLFSVSKDNPDDNRLDGYVYQCERCKRTFVEPSVSAQPEFIEAERRQLAIRSHSRGLGALKGPVRPAR